MGRPHEGPKSANLLIRLDKRRKERVRRAAELSGMSVSDYVRTRLSGIAERDIEEAETGLLRLSRADQIALWSALQNPPPPTRAQRALGELIRSVR